MNKRILSMVITVIFLMIITSTAVAKTPQVHEIQMTDGVELSDFRGSFSGEPMPVHIVEGGYLLGGYHLDDDVIASMDLSDCLLYVNEDFQTQWTLSHPDLMGCLFDQVYETADSFFLGVERKGEVWLPSITKVDKNSGEILWMTDGDPSWTWNHLYVTKEEEIFCVGTQNQASTWEGCLWKLSSDGTLQWKKTLDAYPEPVQSIDCICEWKDQIYVSARTADEVVVFFISEDGDIIAMCPLEHMNPNYTSLKVMDDNHLLVRAIHAPLEGNDNIQYSVLQEEHFIALPNDQ